jgi:Fe-S-cluster formation regulator IscX/YfhJ
VDSTNKVICTVPGFYDKPNLELAEKVLEALNK